MLFSMQHKVFKGEPVLFTKRTAPDWLTCRYTIRGSTMDDRWFWREHVQTLKVGKSVHDDFWIITRIK